MSVNSNFVRRAGEQFIAAWKFCLSFRKRDWRLDDYPVSVRVHEIDPDYIGTRLQQYPYSARIVNWWALSGLGNTTTEALRALEENFESTKTKKIENGERLPRPGTRVPLMFASRIRVGEHAALSEDFARRVLNLDWIWISDESSLWDFHASDTNEELIAKIKDVYGVDVSDIESARLSDIFERIATVHKSA